MLAFLSWLVQKDVFQSIQISFLPPGHTHEDVNQLFSLYAKHFFLSQCSTPEKFEQLVKEKIQNPTFSTHWIHQVFNWKEWFKPVLNVIQGHSGPPAFHIHQSTDGHVLVQALKSST